MIIIIIDYYDAIITACELSKETLMRLFYARKRKPDETLAKYGAALQALLWAAVGQQFLRWTQSTNSV